MSHLKNDVVSRFVRILISIRLIPIKVDYENLCASLTACSIKFVCHIIVAFGPSIIVNVFTFIIFNEEMMMLWHYMKKLLNEDFTAGLAQIVYSYFIFFSFPSMMFNLSYGIPSIPSIALATDLSWPNHGGKIVFAYCLFVMGTSFMNINNVRNLVVLYQQPLTNRHIFVVIQN